MRPITVILLGLMCMASTSAPDVKDFRYQAPILPGPSNAMLASLRLPAGVLQQAAPDLADLRIFDEKGGETPFLISREYWPQQEARSFVWETVSYTYVGAQQIIVLKRPGGQGAFSDVEIVTPDHDFVRSLEVFACNRGQNWSAVAADTIYDYSAHIAVRRTAVPIPATDTEFLKVVLRGKPVPDVEPKDIHLKYRDLEFTLQGNTQRVIRIEQCRSRYAAPTPEINRFDRSVLAPTRSVMDQDRNTIIYLGELRLPAEKIVIDARNPYFYRDCEIWTAATDREEAYTVCSRGSIFRMPGTTEIKNTLALDTCRSSWVRLKIVNNDNPPLELDGITATWTAKDINFFPEARHTYRLYWGAGGVKPGRYELARMLTAQSDLLQRTAPWQLGPIAMNPAYAPHAAGWHGATFERPLLIGLVIIITGLLGVWVFRLMRAVPPPERKKGRGKRPMRHR